jgi:hypothetical protein
MTRPGGVAHQAPRAAAALALALALGPAGCGARTTGPAPAADPRTPIERRRDAACDALAPKLTACAVADTRADLAAGKIDQRQLEHDTSPERQQKLTAKWEADCKGATYSSRQVRVLEVCFREETECAPLVECLDHLHDQVRSRGK